MKKSLIILGAAMLLALTGCKKKEAQAVESATEPVQAEEVVVEQTVDPVQFVNNVMNKDSSVVILPSGLAYQVIKAGQGGSPAAVSNVLVSYTGRHVDGSIFDSSEGNPIQFNLQQVIPGFTEGIMNMNRGAKHIIYIPSNLGYGERGAGDAIAPNEDLIFEIELVDFN